MAVLTPLFGFLGARGFAPGVGVVGLLCLPLARPRRADVAGLVLFALLIGWAVISALWSPFRLAHTAKDLGRFTGLHLAQQLIFCGALIVTVRRLPPATATKALAWMGWGLMALTALLLFEAVSQAALFRSVQPLVGARVPADWAMRSVAQGGYALAMLFWPVILGLRSRGRTLTMEVFVFASAVTLLMLHVAASTVALLISIGVFVLVLRGGRRAALACMAFAVGLTLVTPWLMRGWSEGGLFQSLRPHLPPSWAARVDIWAFTSARMSEKPLWGWGLDASRTFKGHIPLHPHNASLQLWFELGIPGAVLGAMVWAFIFWQFAKACERRRLASAAGCATATVCLIIGAFSFSVWQEWWICLSALAFAACLLLGRQIDVAGGRTDAI